MSNGEATDELARGQAGPVDLAALPVEEIGRILVGVAAHEASTKARFLEALALFVERKGWERWACVSPVQWLSWQCGFNRVTASEHVRVAIALRALPRIAAAMAAGALSWTKVRELTRVAHPSSEAEWLDLGLAATGAQLETLVRAYRRSGLPAAEPVAPRLTWSPQPDGTTVFTLRAPGDVAAALVAAITSVTVAEAGVPLAERRAAALVSLVITDLPAVQPEVVYHVDARAPATMAGPQLRLPGSAASSRHGAPDSDHRMSGDRAPGDRSPVEHPASEHLASDGVVCMSAHGIPVPLDAAAAAACEAPVTTASHHDDSSVVVRRLPRSIGSQLRRHLEARDQRCQFPGCHLQGRLDAHHLVHRRQGGANTADNLSLVCAGHHRLIHRLDLRVTRPPHGGLAVAWPSGDPIEALPLAPTCDPIPDPGRIDPAAVTTATGDPLHLAETVFILRANESVRQAATSPSEPRQRTTGQAA